MQIYIITYIFLITTWKSFYENGIFELQPNLVI